MRLNQYEWMILNGDVLANAIRQEGRMDLQGGEVDRLLTEVQKLDSTGRAKARTLLKQKLEYRGCGELFEL